MGLERGGKRKAGNRVKREAGTHRCFKTGRAKVGGRGETATGPNQETGEDDRKSPENRFATGEAGIR